MAPNHLSLIRIFPWVGKNYEDGGGVFRQKTLILGGSQYSPDSEDFHTEAGRIKWQEFTREVVEYYFDDSIPGRWKGTYTSFINSIYGGPTSEEQRGKFFDAVVFYNYLQEIAGASASEAGNHDYTAPQHSAAFLEVLNEYQPDVVISWGAKVWDALPSDWHHGPAVSGEPVMIEGKDAGSVYSYPFQGRVIRLVGVRHPSIAYDVGFHHELFRRLDLLR
jgi:hypothetical protein